MMGIHAPKGEKSDPSPRKGQSRYCQNQSSSHSLEMPFEGIIKKKGRAGAQRASCR